MRAMLQHAADIETLSNLDAFAEFDTDLMDAVLDEAERAVAAASWCVFTGNLDENA